MQIGSFIRALRWEDISENAQRMAKRCVLDALGCGLAGAWAPGFADLVATLRTHGPDEDVTVWGTSVTMSAPWAVYLNAFSASYFDLDDGHRGAQGHPGAGIVSAGIAMAHRSGRSGRDLLSAVVCGYEVALRSARVMRSLGGPRKGSGAWVTPGVAAVAAKLLDLGPEAIAHAVGLAEFYAPQAPQDRSSRHPSMMKEGIPWGAFTGCMAARLAASGFRAMPSFLENSPWSADLGRVFAIEQVYFKRYAACRFIHPVLDGLAGLKEKTGRNGNDIAAIRIRTFEKGLLLDRREPADPVAAGYSFPFAVASFLKHGRLGPGEVSGPALTDGQVRSLAQRITLEEDRELTALFPERCLARMSVLFQDGLRYESGLLSAKGDPEDPLPDEDLLAKFRLLVEPFPDPAWRTLPALIDRLDRDEGAALQDLAALLRTHPS